MSWQRDWPTAALVLATLILIAPLWCVSSPGMPDYPAHLASFWLIGGGASSFYRVHWVPAPNLASEILVPLLAKLTGLDVAARLFLSAAVALWALGAGAVQKALLGRIGIASLFGAIFAYNANFFWGFFNYYFAAGLGVAVFAAWIASEGRASKSRTIAFTFAVTIVYFCHIFAAASLLVMIAGLETMRGFAAGDVLRRARTVFLIYLPSAIAFVILRPAGTGAQGVAFNLADTMPDRLDSLILRGFDDPIRAVPVALGAALLLLLALRRARIVPAMGPALLVLLAATLLAPESAMGGWGVHLRLPAMFALVLLASVEMKTGRLAPLLAVAALAVAGWLSIGVAQDWRIHDAQTRELRAALSTLPPRTHLLTVLDSQAIGWAADQPYWHMAEWAIIDRDAMTALMFTTRGQHVIALRPPLDHFAAASAVQGMPPDISELDDLAAGQNDGDSDIRDTFPYLRYFPCHYDEALVIHLGGRRSDVPEMLKPHSQGSFFTLYDIAPAAACAAQ